MEGGRDAGGDRAADGEAAVEEAWRACEREGLAAWTAAVVAPGEGGFVAMARERVGGV